MALMFLLGASSGVFADTPGVTDAGASQSLPQENILSSITESLRLDPDHEVVRGHFDLGSPPNAHRYYCLIDAKSGRREPNGVLGNPVRLPDGRTGLKIDSVSLYRCDDAETRGMLITAGYVPNTPGGAPAALSPHVPNAPTASAPAASPGKIDVAGVKLGMPLDQVRALLKSKNLREYNESMETLSYWDAAKIAMRPLAHGRFVSSIAAWSVPVAGDPMNVDGEAFEVMFTPVPGGQRVMAIVHSVGYSLANAVREIALENGLVGKYGGYTQAGDLPDAPTWRLQRGGNVQVGDSCERRAMFGGLGGLNLADRPRENIALKTPLAELQFEVEHCGVAIVTEDHYTANGGALGADRLVTRFTVTAYSPSVALAGAKSAAQLIQAAKGALNGAEASGTKIEPAPYL